MMVGAPAATSDHEITEAMEIMCQDSRVGQVKFSPMNPWSGPQAAANTAELLAILAQVLMSMELAILALGFPPPGFFYIMEKTFMFQPYFAIPN